MNAVNLSLYISKMATLPNNNAESIRRKNVIFMDLLIYGDHYAVDMFNHPQTHKSIWDYPYLHKTMWVNSILLYRVVNMWFYEFEFDNPDPFNKVCLYNGDFRRWLYTEKFQISPILIVKRYENIS